MQWTKTIGGTNVEVAYSIVEAKDKGYVLAGYTMTYGAGSYDVYVVKVDSVGNLKWTKTIGGTGSDQGFSIVRSNDGGYAIAGSTTSYGAGSDDVYVVKLDSLGNLKWTKTIGGTSAEWASSIIQANDHGYAIAGFTRSFGAGNDDIYVIKLDSAGNLKWTKTIGGVSAEIGSSIIQTKDKGYVVSGSTTSYGAGNQDVYFIKLDSLGNLLYTKTIGGRGNDEAIAILTKDGGFALGGSTSSYGDTVNDNIYILKVDSLGNLCSAEGSGGTITTSDSGRVSSGGIAGSGGIVGTGGTITSRDSGQVTEVCHSVSTSVSSVKSVQNNIQIYPNPCSNKLYLNFEKQYSLYGIEITDITGRVLLSANIQNPVFGNELDVSSLSSGMYFLRINSGSGIEVKKFIKE